MGVGFGFLKCWCGCEVRIYAMAVERNFYLGLARQREYERLEKEQRNEKK